MATIVEPLRPPRILERPKKFAPLRGFSCGRAGMPWEKLVNEAARDLYAGMGTSAQTVVVMEDANGKLVGFCTARPEPIPIPGGRLIRPAWCIHMLGTDRLCRGRRLEDGSRPGDVLLRGALEWLELKCNGRMPYVWALVSPENDRSRALFARHRFGEVPYAGGGEIKYLRTPQGRRFVARTPSGLKRRLTDGSSPPPERTDRPSGRAREAA